MSLNSQPLIESSEPQQPSATVPQPSDKLRRARWAFLILLVLFIGSIVAIVVIAISGSNKQGEIDELSRQIDDMNTKQSDLYFRKQLKFDAMRVKGFTVQVGNGTQEIMRGLPQIISLDLSGNDIAQFENNALPDLQTLNLKSNPIVSFSGNSMDALTNIDADFFKIVRFNDNFLPKIADLRFEPQSEFCGNTMATLSQLTINTALLRANSLPSLTTVDIYIVGEFGSNALTVSRQFRIKNVKVFKNNTINAEWVPIELQSAGIEIFEDNTFTDVMTLLLMNNSIKAFDRNTVSCKKQTEYNFLQGNPLQSFSGNTLSGFKSLVFDSPIRFFNGNNLIQTQNLTLVGNLQTFNSNNFSLFSMNLTSKTLKSFLNNTSPSLHFLNLSLNSLTHLSFLNNTFPSISQIDLSHNSLTSFPQLPSSIRTVLLQSNNITSLPKSLPSLHPNLNVLYLSNNSISGLDLPPNGISVMVLRYNNFTGIGMNDTDYPMLTTLDLSYNKIKEVNLKFGVGVPVTVDLSGNEVMGELEEASVVCTRLYMNGMVGLTGITKGVFMIEISLFLEAEELQRIQGTFFMMQVMSWKLPVLKSFTNNSIMVKEFTLNNTMLSEFDQITLQDVVKLDLSFNKLQSLGDMSSTQNIRELYLNNNLFDDNGAKLIVKDLPKQIQIIDLRNNPNIKNPPDVLQYLTSQLPNTQIRI